MAKTTNTAEEPTIAELVEAINELNSRQEAAEAARAEAGGDDTLSPEQIATLESLYNGSEAFLANYNRQNGTKVTRADINAAVDQFNASVDAAGGGDGDGDGSWDGDGDGGEVAGGAAAAAVAGGETSAAGTQLAAVHRELIQLKAKIDRKERIELQQAETLEFEAVEHNFAVLTEQRDQAIELAEKLVAENEALRLHLSTGTRPVRAGLDNGVRLFHAVDGELHEFQQNVKARMKADKISEGKAIMLESHENPALHADWVNSNRTVRA